ncbi:MAG: hypothetical protein LJF06_13530, partial [Gemmatimonadetes bacterium]|nr:hypothetical protein [Gemmatimonadota bacterium]
SAPSSTSADVSASFRVKTGSLTHLLQVGVQYTYGSFLNQRIRNGGMTWLPAAVEGFDPSDPSTWADPTGGWTATEWGGEVHLNADVANTAAYAQSSISLGSRVVLSPGVRWGRWQGWIDPTSGSRFEAVHDDAFDPRVGLTVNLVPDGTWTAKAHWGRYHQDMMTQMFDRAAGSDVFTNQEIWYYRGPPVSDPATTFTVAQRDSLAALGLFTQETVQPLNQTGPVENYHQPYTNEWLLGIEKQFGHTAKLSFVYTRRTNHDMVALIDRNIATNYTYFPLVRAGGYGNGVPQPITPGDANGHYPGTNGFYLGGVWLPNNELLQRLRCRGEGTCPNLVDIPGLTYADTASLTWNPNYTVTNAPDARRSFDQFQMVLNVSKPTWGGSFSAVWTSLKGNLDNVTGYTDPSTFDAGPYVNLNEATNDYGNLPNYANLEAKVSVWGNLPLQMQGGLFWTFRTGDYYSSTFRLTSLGIYSYDVIRLEGRWNPQPVAERLDYRLFAPLEGQDMFILERGRYKMPARANVDAHLERPFSVGGRHLLVSMDVFNLLNRGAPTDIQSALNYGINPWGYSSANIANNAYFGYALQRMPPRTFRLSAQVRF